VAVTAVLDDDDDDDDVSDAWTGGEPFAAPEREPSAAGREPSAAEREPSAAEREPSAAEREAAAAEREAAADAAEAAGGRKSRRQTAGVAAKRFDDEYKPPAPRRLNRARQSKSERPAE